MRERRSRSTEEVAEMDDLQELRALRAEVPRREARAHARAAAALDARLRVPSSAPRRWRPRILIPAIAAATTIAVLATAIGIGRGPEQASAATVLQDAARKLEAAPATPLAAGQYWYVEQRGHTLNTSAVSDDNSYSALMTTVHKLWVGLDGSGRIVRTDEDPQFVTPADRERWIAGGSQPLTGGGIDEQEPAGELSFAFGSRSLTYDELRALPSDPAELGPMVQTAAVANTWSPAWEQLDLIAELLRGAPLTPAQSAALYDVASTLPGIELVGPARDSLGRTGVAVAVTSNGFREELILDPQTGQLLGEQQTNLVERSDLPEGTVLEAVSYVRTGVVDSTTQQP
jgi:hypothetical protein